MTAMPSVVQRARTDRFAKSGLAQTEKVGLPRDGMITLSEAAKKLESRIAEAVQNEKVGLPTGLPQGGKRERQYLDVRLSSKDATTAAIVADWKAEKQGASNIQKAIRLFDAILRCDVETITEIAPQLPALLKGGKAKTRSPYNSSDLKKGTEPLNAEEKGVCDKIAEITATEMCIRGNRDAIEKLARQLVSGGYTAVQVDEWHQRYWKVIDWRGNGSKGHAERPTVKSLGELIGHVKNLAPSPGLPVYSPHYDPPTPIQVADPVPAVDPVPLPPRSAPPVPDPIIPAAARDAWEMVKSELSVSLPKATFDTWVRRVQLVDFENGADRDRFVLSVPHRYAADHLERTLSHWIERELPDRYALMARCPERPVDLEFEIVEADCDVRDLYGGHHVAQPGAMV